MGSLGRLWFLAVSAPAAVSKPGGFHSSAACVDKYNRIDKWPLRFFVGSFRKQLWLLATLIAITTPLALQAQIVETGTITGVVRDSSGAVIAVAQVNIRNAATGLNNATVTDSRGLYVSP